MEPSTNNNLKQGLLGGLAIVLVGTLAFFLSKNSGVTTEQIPEPTSPSNNNTQATNQPQVQVPTTTPSNAGTKTSVYKDGTYTANATYNSPGGSGKISITIALTNGVITSSSFSGTPSNPVSEKLQSGFNSAYKQQVIGKSIEGLNLSVVNGASLTTRSFTEALESVRSQAKS